ncbi:hypothetical protein Syun_016573 [Stephania yunnanensis]|uniref:Uncharacterized protein n=1 Tax=Stephania yunnanensis TaxID=152371 RepID=A0AAP0J557_9MAGN
MADEIRFRRVALLVIIVITVFAMRFQISRASQSDHRYAVGEDVPLYVAKVNAIAIGMLKETLFKEAIARN